MRHWEDEMSNVYVRGSVATITTTMKKNGILTDVVGTIALTVEREDGTTDGPFTPVHVSTGTYSFDYETVAKGWCKTRVEISDPKGADEGGFNVVSSF